jgi:hypothetical protein
LRCAAAILKKDPTPDTLLELNGQLLRAAISQGQEWDFGCYRLSKNAVEGYVPEELTILCVDHSSMYLFAEPDGKEVSMTQSYARFKKWYLAILLYQPMDGSRPK